MLLPISVSCCVYQGSLVCAYAVSCQLFSVNGICWMGYEISIREACLDLYKVLGAHGHFLLATSGCPPTSRSCFIAT